MYENGRKPLINRQNKQEHIYTIYKANSNNNNAGYMENTEFKQIDGGYGSIVRLASFWCLGIILSMDYNNFLIYAKYQYIINFYGFDNRLSTANYVFFAGK